MRKLRTFGALASLFLLLAGAALAGDGGTPSDFLVYRDGDVLRGALESLTPQGGALRWSAGPLAGFSTEALYAAFLRGRPPLQGMRNPRASVKLTNGDSLTGDVRSLDAQALKMDTWYAGTLTLKRTMVASVEMLKDEGAIFYEGPKEAGEWKSAARASESKKSWDFQGGTLVCVPAECFSVFHVIPELAKEAALRVGFDLSAGAGVTASVSLCSGPEDGGIAGIRWELEERQLSGWFGGSRRLSVSLASGLVPSVRRMELFLDRKKRTCTVELNGVRTATLSWKAADDKKLSGDRMVFSPQAPGETETPFQVSRIRVTRWDGVLPSASTLSGPAPAEDELQLVSGDHVSGKLTGLVKGVYLLETSYAKLRFPPAAVESLRFSGKGAEVARLRVGDLRATLAGGSGVVTLCLSGLRGGALSGTSENFGPFAVPLAALEKMEFSLYGSAGAEAARQPADQLTFDGGSRLCGELTALSADGNGSAVWPHAAGAALPFAGCGLRTVVLKERPAPERRDGRDAVVLDNGDRLPGELVSLDDKRLVLDTWYAGRLQVDRGRIRQLFPDEFGRVCYRGPDAGAGWVPWVWWQGMQTAGLFNIEDRVLRITAKNGGGGAARDVAELPDAVRLEFDVTWDTASAMPGYDSMFGFSCGLFGKDGRMSNMGAGNTAGCRMNVDYGGLIVEWTSKTKEGTASTKTKRLASSDEYRRLLKAGGNRLHVVLLADRRARRGAILLNGTLAGEFAGVEDALDPLNFFHMGSSGGRRTEFRNIRISTWNGRIPLQAAAVESGQDVLILAGGDAVSGRLAGLADGKFRLETGFGGAMVIPMAKVLEVRVAGKGGAEAKPGPGDARALMGCDGSFLLRRARVDGGMLQGTLAGAGEVAVHLSALSGIDFNAAAPRRNAVPEWMLPKPKVDDNASRLREMMINNQVIFAD